MILVLADARVRDVSKVDLTPNTPSVIDIASEASGVSFDANSASRVYDFVRAAEELDQVYGCKPGQSAATSPCDQFFIVHVTPEAESVASKEAWLLSLPTTYSLGAATADSVSAEGAHLLATDSTYSKRVLPALRPNGCHAVR